MRTIVFATNNSSKLKELNEIFTAIGGGEYKLLSLKDCGFSGEIVEDADTFEGNAYIKAKAVADFTGLATIADDSGLEVDALNGAPGVYSARYAGEGASANALIAKLLKELDGVPAADRTAHFTTVMCAVLPGGKTLSEKGRCHGVILEQPIGNGGFGYDPVFYYPAYQKTFAQMDEAEKNSISHRAVAADKLIKALHALSDNDFTAVK